MLDVTPKAKMLTPHPFNLVAGISGVTPLFDFPSVRTKITFLALDLAPAAELKMRLVRTYSSALPVAVEPPVYLRRKEISQVMFTWKGASPPSRACPFCRDLASLGNLL